MSVKRLLILAEILQLEELINTTLADNIVERMTVEARLQAAKEALMTLKDKPFIPVGNFNNNGDGKGYNSINNDYICDEYEVHQLSDQGGIKHYVFVYNHGLGFGAISSSSRRRC